MRLVAATAVIFISALPVAAGNVFVPPPTAVGSDTDTKGFVGLNWTFGSNSAGAEAVVGVARVKTESDGDARGAKLSVHLPLQNGLSFGKVKLVGVTGESDRMAEAGVGWSTDGIFGTAGVWAPYLNAGADFGLSGFNGYVGLNSLDEWNVPQPAVLPN